MTGGAGSRSRYPCCRCCCSASDLNDAFKIWPVSGDLNGLRKFASRVKLSAELAGKVLNKAAKESLADETMGFAGTDLPRVDIWSFFPPIMHSWIRAVSTMWLVVTMILKRAGLLKAAIARMTAPVK